MKVFAIGLSALVILAGCTAAEVAAFNTKGQLFCSKATADGPLVVALVDATANPAAIIATGATAEFVDAACAAWDSSAVPVSPPAGTVPTVAVVVPSGV